MRTEKRVADQSLAGHLKRAHRCSVCGRKMTSPQSIMSADGIGFCDACYRDRFFEDVGSHHRQMIDHRDA